MYPKKRFSNKGQITPFMIIGLVVLIIVFAAIYVGYISSTTPLQLKGEELTGPKLESTFRLYVEECIQQEAKDPLIKIGLQGGTLWPSEPSFLYYNKSKINYLCYAEGLDPSYSCINSMLTKGQMEYELSYEFKNRIKKCVKLSEFKRFVDNIQAGEMTVYVDIAKNDISVHVNYPVNMTFGDYAISISDYQSTLDYPLGRLHSVAQSVINKEVTSGYFDIDEWMVKYGADVIIEKHRPYPDRVYILSKEGYSFQFALQGLPTSGDYIEQKEDYFGCCFDSMSDMCFKNVDPLRCISLAGDYNPDVDCSCTASYEPREPCVGAACNDCSSEGRVHGESWCAYDSIVGEGYDYVGTRHYKQSCINGQVIIEDCRDFRQELCSEGFISGKSKAVCRPNRWQTCLQCDSKSCCDDKRFRDCYWDSDLETQGKCIPEVPPGLRFWENEGADICLRGNQKEKCTGLTCPQEWLDSAARYCYSQGDCGNYRNFNDDLTMTGFYETDILKNVNRTAYPEEGLNTNPLSDGTRWKLNLGFERKSSRVVESVQQHFSTLSVFVASLSSFFNQISKISPSAYANPFVSRQKLEIEDFSICNLWMPPEEGDCSLCSYDLVRPCTEYRCKSISEKCQFEIKEGVPLCSKMHIMDFSSPKVDIDIDTISSQYGLERTSLAGYEGFRIIEPVRPHKPFTVGIKTDEETRCSVSLTPRIEGYSLQTVLIGDGVFRTKHNITIRMPPRLVIPETLYESINFASTRSLVDLIYNIKSIMDSISESLGPELEIYGRITGNDFIKQIKPKVEKISSLLTDVRYDVDQVVRGLLTQFDKGGYYLFFDCTDRSGNKNENQVFIQFIVDYGYTDEEAPVIITTDPPNNGKMNPLDETVTLRIYLDEPSECRYDYYDTGFDIMNYSFSCLTGDYGITPIAGGTYECSAEIRTPFADNDIFIICADNPKSIMSHSLRMFTSPAPLIQGIESYSSGFDNANPMDYLTLNESVIGVPAEMLDNLVFGINSSEIRLDLYLGESKSCRYSLQDTDFSSMKGSFDSCIISEDLKKGTYSCSAHFDLEEKDRNNLGNYVLNLDITNRNKTVDVNPERIIIYNDTIDLRFRKNLQGEDSIELDYSTPRIILRINESAKCSFALDNNDQMQAMGCMDYGSHSICSYNADLQESSKLTFECMNLTEPEFLNRTFQFYIKCLDSYAPAQNIPEQSYHYLISKADELKIIEIKPSGVISSSEEEITVRVSEDITQNEIKCGFNDNPYAFLSMEKASHRDFRAILPGLEEDKEYTYYIRCTDKYGGSVMETTTFNLMT
ncbi:MAG: hypothetical protein KKE20_06865 [Nanoarchaeota archaeon]|nr:hypothetical protein [Nanoarchaeota archaeon]